MNAIKKTDTKLKLVLFVFAFLMFATTLGHDYAWDDSIVITENPRVKKGIPGIADLFLKYNSDYRSDKYGYRPIVLASFALDYSFFGLSARASHFMNVFYFSLLCILLFHTLQKIFSNFSSLAPFLITAVFIVHPIHTEVVANIKSRDEIFSLLFSLLSLNYFLSYHATRRISSLVFSALLFLLAFLSKESAITFLAIMPLTLFYKEGWTNGKRVLVSSLCIPVLLIVCALILKLSASSQLGATSLKGAGVYYESDILGNSFFYTSVLSTKLANAFTVLVLYLKNFFYPVTLLYYYGYNQIPVASWHEPLVIFSFLFHLAALGFAIVYAKKYCEISFGIFYYFITISIYTHLFRTLSDTMADRFLFMPSLGLSILLVFTISSLLKINLGPLKAEMLWKNDKTEPRFTSMRYIVLVIILLLSIKTFTHNKVWKNEETLVMSDMPRLENCSRANGYYADILRKKMASGYDRVMETEMIARYKKSYHISKEAYYSYLGLATYFCGAKRFEEGIVVLDSMIRIYPDQADPNFYLGQAYYQTQQYKKALPYLEKSIELAPEVESSYVTTALAFSKNGEPEKALSTLNTAKKKFGESFFNYEAMSTVYFEQGDMDNATKASLQLLKLGGDAQLIYSSIIGRYQVKKQDSLAARYYKEALSKGLFKKTN